MVLGLVKVEVVRWEKLASMNWVKPCEKCMNGPMVKISDKTEGVFSISSLYQRIYRVEVE